MYKGSCSLNSHCRRTSGITAKKALDSSSSQQIPAYRKQWKPLRIILKQGQVSTTPTSVLCRSCKVHFSVVSCLTLSLPILVVLERFHGPELPRLRLSPLRCRLMVDAGKGRVPRRPSSSWAGANGSAAALTVALSPAASAKPAAASLCLLGQNLGKELDTNGFLLGRLQRKT